MSGVPYLLDLGARLTNGLAAFPEDFRARHRQFVQSKLADDGGFVGREGGADLYYTGFGVRCLSLLNGLNVGLAERLAEYLRATAASATSSIDLVSWLYSTLAVGLAGGPHLLADADDAWADRIAEWLESFRAPDGGYAKSRQGVMGSTYHSFLTMLGYELIDRPVPEMEQLLAFIRKRQRDDGGFVEIDPMKQSGANPTAAAAAILSRAGAINKELRQDVADFLTTVRGDEGGFQANQRIPFADSLSTFTAVLTAVDLGIGDAFDPDVVRRFILGLEWEAGGFRGAAWDTTADVEYTFYALGTLALVGPRRA